VVAPAHVRFLVDLEGQVAQPWEVDGTALEAGVHADSQGFGGHPLWSEKRHHLLWMNRRSRLRGEVSCM
jgi:hypothetical protein